MEASSASNGRCEAETVTGGAGKIQVRNARCASGFDVSADRLPSPCWTARVVERSRSRGDSPIPSIVFELNVYRFGFPYLVGYYVNRTQCPYRPNKALRRLKYTRNFFVCDADKSQGVEGDHADEVIAMDLWSAHFVPRRYWFCFIARYRQRCVYTRGLIKPA